MSSQGISAYHGGPIPDNHPRRHRPSGRYQLRRGRQNVHLPRPWLQPLLPWDGRDRVSGRNAGDPLACAMPSRL
jgi:hypothetical protein